MFDIAWSELMVIAVVALVVIGPKDLPKTIFTLGKWVRKARVVAREFQGHVDDLMREAELDELRREALKVRDTNIRKMVEDTVDQKGELRGAFDVGLNGYPGSPPEDEPAPHTAPQTAEVGAPAVAAAQPLPATEPPVTVPAPPAPPAEFVPAPAPVPTAEPATVTQTTNKQA